MTAAIEHALAAADARFAAILCDGRGRDGSLGADAALRAIAAKTFRRVYAPLTDAGLSDEFFSRGAYLYWPSVTSEPRNTRDPEQEIAATIELAVGYVAGTATAAGDLTLTAPDSTEVAATLARSPTLYAQGDARRIHLAFEWRELFADASDVHPILDVTRTGAASVFAISPTRFVCSQTFAVRLWCTAAPSPATP